MADYPTAYEGQPGFEFLQRVPTWWDETRVLAAHIGELLVTAKDAPKVEAAAKPQAEEVKTVPVDAETAEAIKEVASEAETPAPSGV